MVTDINSNVELHKQLSTSECQKLINTGVETHLLFHATPSLGTLIDDMISKVKFWFTNIEMCLLFVNG